MKYSVIIPTYGQHLEDLLKPCLESIKQYTVLEDIEIIVVANGCTDNTKEYTESLGEPFKLLWFDEGLGYTRATNEGIKVSIGDYIVLLNNDTVLLEQEKSKWLNLLTEPFLINKKAAVTGPLQSYCSYADRTFLIFFCVMTSRKIINEFGLLDETFSPGFGEDSDYCIKVQNAGYETIQVPAQPLSNHEKKLMIGSFPIYHKAEGTFETYPGVDNILAERRFILMNRYRKNIKLNLGCGKIKVPGYFNIDIDDKEADMIWDVRKIPLEDGRVEEIMALHLLEHFDPWEISDILKEWNRLLKPGGKLILELPDMEVLCKEFTNGAKEVRYKILNFIYSTATPKYPHKFGWYWDILFDHLTNAGFCNLSKINKDIYNIKIECIKPSYLPDGFFGDCDITTYRNLIKTRVSDNGIIAELGSWKGRSLCSAADIIKEKNIQVISVDTFTGSCSEVEGMASPIDASKEDIKTIFLNSMKKSELDPIIYQTTTHNASSQFKDQVFDLVFIDADHSYESVKQDIQDWWPKVKRGGLLAGHDCAWPDVARALREEFGHMAYTDGNNIWWIDRHKVYDCFMFCDELDLLEIRLNELNNEVDYFVLVEGTETFSGKPKPLYFEENKQRFEKFLPKIRHIIIDKWPEYIEGNPDSAWARERIQRDGMLQGITDARPCDVFIFGDGDEIPSAKAVRSYRKHMGIVNLEMNFYYYYLNYLSSENNGKWAESKMVYAEYFQGKTPCAIRYTTWNFPGHFAPEVSLVKPTIMPDAGWHFSFQGGTDAIIKKIESYAHQEYNKPEIKERSRVEQLVDEGKDVFGRQTTYNTVSVDESYPVYLRENLDKFKHMIKE